MSVLKGDVYIDGDFRCNSMQIPYNSVGDVHITASAGPIQYNKMEQQRAAKYTQKYGTAVVSERTGIHIGLGSGTILYFFAALAVPCSGAATVTVDLLKNGVTVLSGIITFNSGVAAFSPVIGTLSGSNYISSDVYEVNVTATAGGGTIGQGLTVMLYTKESPV